MTNSLRNNQNVLFFLLIITLTLVDILLDYNYGVNIKHLLIEFIVLFISLIGFNFYFEKLKSDQKKQNTHFQEILNEAHKTKGQVENLTHKISSYKTEFKNEIDQQFKAWKFTPSEHEVALLLLKGLSLKEIAELRHSNEKTVRAQCTSVYRKSELKGRHQLSSFFLDFIF